MHSHLIIFSTFVRSTYSLHVYPLIALKRAVSGPLNSLVVPTMESRLLILPRTSNSFVASLMTPSVSKIYRRGCRKIDELERTWKEISVT
jgi:hypothetical protein